MNVFYLADKPKYLQAVVDVFYQEWGGPKSKQQPMFLGHR